MKLKCMLNKICYDIWWNNEVFFVMAIGVLVSVGITWFAYASPVAFVVSCGIALLIGILWLVYKLCLYIRDVIEWCNEPVIK